jgi:hypothetical protein
MEDSPRSSLISSLGLIPDKYWKSSRGALPCSISQSVSPDFGIGVPWPYAARVIGPRAFRRTTQCLAALVELPLIAEAPHAANPSQQV